MIIFSDTLTTYYLILATLLFILGLIVNPFTWIKNQPLFADRRAVWLLVINAVATAFTVLYSISSIERREFKVPIRYSGFNEGSFSDRGDWYSLYAFPIFALVTFGFTLVLALRLHRMRPELAQGLLGVQLVVTTFTFLVARALTSLL